MAQQKNYAQQEPRPMPSFNMNSLGSRTPPGVPDLFQTDQLDFGGGMPQTLPGRLKSWYASSADPWFPKDMVLPTDGRGLPGEQLLSPGAPGPSFSQFRGNPVPSEAETSYGDSGYASGGQWHPQDDEQSAVYDGVNDASQETGSLARHFSAMTGFGLQSRVLPLPARNWGPPGSDMQTSKPVAEEATSPLLCHECQKVLKTKSEFNKHIQRHTKPFHCGVEHCNRVSGFSTSNDLDRHKRSKHPSLFEADAVPFFQCPHGVCGKKDKKWPRADNFRSHLKRVHLIEIKPEDSLSEYVYGSNENNAILAERSITTDLAGLTTSQSRDTFPAQSDAQQAGIPSSPVWESMNQGDDLNISQEHSPVVTGKDVSNTLSKPAQRPVGPPVGGRRIDASGDGSTVNIQEDTATATEVPVAEESAAAASRSNVAARRGLDFAQSKTAPNGGRTAAASPPTQNGPVPSAIATVEGAINNGSQYGIKSTSAPAQPTDVAMTNGVADDNATALGADGSRAGSSSDVEEDDADAAPKQGSSRHGRSAASRGIAQEQMAKEQAVEQLAPAQREAREFEQLTKLNEDGVLLKFLRANRGIFNLLEKEIESEKDEIAQPATATSSATHHYRCKVERCQKSFPLMCQLRKHMKRHDKPFSCTQEDCNKKFGSKNDWKRHENSQHFQLEVWRCDEEDGKCADGSPKHCDQVLYRRETFKGHLESAHDIHDMRDIEERWERCRVGRNSEVRFWCGFCEEIVNIPASVITSASRTVAANVAADAASTAANPAGGSGGGPAASWSVRFDHISRHYEVDKKSKSQWKSFDPAAQEAVQAAAAKARATKAAAARGGGSDDGESDDISTGSESSQSSAASSAAGSPGHSHGLKRRASDDADHREAKRPKNMTYMVQCCQCNGVFNQKTTPRCVNEDQHEWCKDCQITARKVDD